MFNGFPLHLAEYRGYTDGDIGEHEEGKCECIDNLFQYRGPNTLPLGDSGNSTYQQQQKVGRDKRYQRGNKEGQNILSSEELQDSDHGAAGKNGSGTCPKPQPAPVPEARAQNEQGRCCRTGEIRDAVRDRSGPAKSPEAKDVSAAGRNFPDPDGKRACSSGKKDWTRGIRNRHCNK